VVATGRSLFSFRKVADVDLPVDYVIFSTGAGVLHFPGARILRETNLTPEEAARVADVFWTADLDFMLHRPLPDNHRFAFWASGRENPDFRRRIALYSDFCRPLESPPERFGPAAQLLAVVTPEVPLSFLEGLREKLKGFNVIRTTSPLDGRSTWVEVFPRQVSKSLTTGWLAAELGLGPRNALAVGNDYNDLDLLQWSGASFVVANAPGDLKRRFRSVASNDRCGVTEAVTRWLGNNALETTGG
ncbi:MAG: Cof-type HAD-IIB family hydrolase, partial [Desulfobacterales bacterium]|nr:Cof-type HAD-IIB family hydrolase [Desulfobacterales bacterium]